MSTGEKTIVLVDGKNCAYRSHFKHINLSSRGRSTSIIFGMLSMLVSIKNRLAAPVAIVWDGKPPTWRHELTKHRGKKQYKGNRNFDATRKMVHEQSEIVKEFLTSIGVVNFEVDHLEADDLIGILSKALVKNGYDKIIIYSGDRDYFQLLSDKVIIFSPQGRRRNMTLTKERMEKLWKVTPDEYVKMRALCGDKSDNISNVIHGIGKVTATKLVKAGLDPSIKDFSYLSSEVQYIAAKKKINANLWPMVFENYKLCKILRKPTNDLDESTYDEVCWILENIKKHGLGFPVSRTRSLASYRYMLDFFVNYELDELFDRRQQIWDLSQAETRPQFTY